MTDEQLDALSDRQIDYLWTNMTEEEQALPYGKNLEARVCEAYHKRIAEYKKSMKTTYIK